MGMQTQVTEAQLVDSRAVQTQRRLLVAAWVMAALLAALVVALLVQGARIADLEKSVQQAEFSTGDAAFDPSAGQQVLEVCRLLGAVAEKNDIALGDVFNGQTMNGCEALAREGASAVRATG